jgi:hypothetical protein
MKDNDHNQQTIRLMATVSFQIKEWNIGLVSVFLAFAVYLLR